MSSAAARSGTAAKGFVGARWWGKPRGEPNVGVLPADDTGSRMSEQKQQGRPHQLRCSSPASRTSSTKKPSEEAKVTKKRRSERRLPPLSVRKPNTTRRWARVPEVSLCTPSNGHVSVSLCAPSAC